MKTLYLGDGAFVELTLDSKVVLYTNHGIEGNFAILDNRAANLLLEWLTKVLGESKT